MATMKSRRTKTDLRHAAAPTAKKPEPPKPTKTIRHRFMRTLDVPQETNLGKLLEQLWPRKDAKNRTWVLDSIQTGGKVMPAGASLELHDTRGCVGETPGKLLNTTPWALGLAVENGLRLRVTGVEYDDITITIQATATTIEDA